MKVAIEIGGLTIHWYGVLVAAGFLLGLSTASRRAIRDGIPGEQVVDVGVWLIVGTIIGARALYVISYWEHFVDKPWWEILNLRGGGLVYYGGFIGAALAGFFYVRARRLNFWKLADVLAPSIPLGQAIGRLGCLMNGCCYGRPTRLPWAIYYPEPHEACGTGVHPAQLYEAILTLGLYGVLAWVHQHRKFTGQTFCAYLIGYALVRTFVETFRGDYRNLLGGWLTPGQFVSALILAAGIAIWWKRTPGQARSPTTR